MEDIADAINSLATELERYNEMRIVELRLKFLEMDPEKTTEYGGMWALPNFLEPD